MRATEFVRGILDLLDKIDGDRIDMDVDIHTGTVPNEPGEQTSRFKQIASILDSDDNEGDYANSPNEVVSDVDSVTVDAGGGVNGSKHSDDIRVKDPRGYE
jgi:hypothetical protein